MNINAAIETALSKTIHAAVDRETVGWRKTIVKRNPGRMVIRIHGMLQETPGRVPLVSGIIPKRDTHPEYYLRTHNGILLKSANWDRNSQTFGDNLAFRSVHGESGFEYGCVDKYRERMLALNPIERHIQADSPMLKDTWMRVVDKIKMFDGINWKFIWAECDPSHPEAVKTWMNPKWLWREPHSVHDEGMLLVKDMKLYMPKLVQLKAQVIPLFGVPHSFLPEKEFIRRAKIVDSRTHASAAQLRETYLTDNPYEERMA